MNRKIFNGFSPSVHFGFLQALIFLSEELTDERFSRSFLGEVNFIVR
ncbi:hypothetical protein [Fulvivirga sp. M361]|nr:hypothetical protein [Fulvivirga sp. M361]